KSTRCTISPATPPRSACGGWWRRRSSWRAPPCSPASGSNAGGRAVSRLEFACALTYPRRFPLHAPLAPDADLPLLSGPSGSGKTTIRSLIAGLRRPHRGAIRLGDTVLFDAERHVNLPPERRRVGYVFQEHLLFPHLSARRNLEYGWRRRPADAQAVD